jgi:SAM-dependent methyltransferase
MPTPNAPFTDPDLITGALYSSADRLQHRTSALHRAKTAGADATDTIAALALTAQPAPTRVADIGCGRGTSTVRLARQYPMASLYAVDQSPALLAVVHDRLRAQNHQAHLVKADFHNLPDDLRGLDLAVLAFCLYHSSHPGQVLAAVADRLNPAGSLIIVTKSANSYHEIDETVAASVDPEATQRPSLYESFHTDNAAAVLAEAGLKLHHRLDQQHTFTFGDAEHLAEYAATSPKYQFPPGLTDDLGELAGALRPYVPTTGLIATSTVTYLVAVRP